MRKVLSLALAAALLLSAAGCAALFDKEVYSEEVYEAPSEAAEPDGEADAISNYAALRRAIIRLVAEHAESAELQIQNYDGSISQDISTACWEVKSSTALGAFAVDYISYDLSRIVSYYQAKIYITYKRSEYQTSLLEQTENLSAMRRRLEEAVRAGETYVLMELTAASLSGETVARSVEQFYYEDPLACPVLPAVEAAVYPETGVNRIVEVTLDYGMDGETLARQREALAEAVDAMAAACLTPPAEELPAEEELPPEEESLPEDEVSPEDGSSPEGDLAPAGAAPSEAEIVRALCVYLAERCRPDETAGNTALDALTGGAAGSEGMAMALMAGCRAADIPCRIVFGRLDGEPHVWDIVTVEHGTYHADVSNWAAGEENVFLAGDEDLWGAYWWDTSEYPPCPERYGAPEAPSEEPSGEASAEEPASGSDIIGAGGDIGPAEIPGETAGPEPPDVGQDIGEY